MYLFPVVLMCDTCSHKYGLHDILILYTVVSIHLWFAIQICAVNVDWIHIELQHIELQHIELQPRSFTV